MTWDTKALGRLLLRAPSLRIALGFALNKDLARKVARAWTSTLPGQGVRATIS